MGAGDARAAAVACAFGVQRDRSADGVGVSVAHHRAGAGEVHRVAFGSGMQADALNAAFVLPDMISYFLVGGAASITFVTILTRYRETGREKLRANVRFL